VLSPPWPRPRSRRFLGLLNWADPPGASYSDLDTILVTFEAPRLMAELCRPHMPVGGAIASIASTARAADVADIGNWLPLVSIPDFAGPKAQREERPKAQREERPKDIDSGYVPSKEAVIFWTTFAASDYASDSSCVNGISTGPNYTPMMPDFEKTPSAALIDQFTTCVERRSTPEEQAYPMVFHNSAAANCISGENLHTDGGTTGGLTPGQFEPRPRSRGRRRTGRRHHIARVGFRCTDREPTRGHRPVRLGAFAHERVASPIRLRRPLLAGPLHLLSEKPAQGGGIAQQAAQRCARRLCRRGVIPVGDGEHLVEDREALA